MASTFLLTLCLGMLASCLAAPASNIRWCVKSEAEFRKCLDISRNCACETITLSCVHKSSTDECFTAISEGQADAITLDSGDIYRASLNPYNLKPIIAESYGTAEEPDTCYYAMALVKKSSTFTFDELQGKRSCHTAVGRAAGWKTPIGVLLAHQKIQWGGPEVESLEKAVTGYFASSCAPGATEEKLCRQCAGQGKDKKCKLSENEPYYGYEGACKCLKEGKGDVAFVKNLLSEKCKEDTEWLCLDNTRKPIKDYEQCSWGRIPAHAVVSVNNEEKIKLITEFLTQAQKKQECKLFDSTHGKDLMFKSSAQSLIPIPAKVDAFLYLGRELSNSIKAMHKELEIPSEDKIRWCTQGREENLKCDTWTVVSGGAIECVQASSAEECIVKVLKGEADAVTLDGGYQYTAGACGLVPVMGEIYDADECKRTGSTTPGSYYAVAVIKASDKDTTWNKLKGKKSCHTAIGRSAGWNIPVGLIIKQTEICDMSTFFKESCAPGADVKSNLCSLCAGEPTKISNDAKCQANNKESFYGYSGAFRCLIERGDVCFVKHTTAFETIKANPAWMKGKTQDDFRLLCLDGSVRPLADYKECHLAEVPAHAVVTVPSRKRAVVNILKQQQSKYGKGTTEFFSMFTSDGGKDQLFKNSTECLREINVPSMNEHLGKEYIDSVTSLNKCTESKSELLAACTFHTCKI